MFPLGTAVIVLIVCPNLALAAGKEENDAFNVFTDIAPLLALFGEQFARQFISESLTWLDHIIFAMVPLGIITAITGAIRISGPTWARAFIGRARETRAVAEIEFMSSTSKEVCEVFNGRGIVRTMGAPRLTQFLLFPKRYRRDATWGIHTLETAYNFHPPLVKRGHFDVSGRWRHNKESMIHSLQSLKEESSTKRLVKFPVRSRRPWRPQLTFDDPEFGGNEHSTKTIGSSSLPQPAPTQDNLKAATTAAFPAELRQSAPNLQLNLPSTVPSHSNSIKRHKVAAAFAILVQASVILASALSTFHPVALRKFTEPKNKKVFPLFICGTFCLNIGMLLCSWVIDRSTRERVWRVVTPGKNRLPERRKASVQPDPMEKEPSTEECTVQLFWLQERHVVSDQDIDSFLILGGSKEALLTSSRLEHQLKKFKTITVLGALLGMVGFVLQFEGLRSLPWPTAFAHVVGILIMAVVRALARRHLGKCPSVISAQRGHELDWLALRLVYEKFPLEPPAKYKKHQSRSLGINWGVLTPPTVPVQCDDDSFDEPVLIGDVEPDANATGNACPYFFAQPGIMVPIYDGSEANNNEPVISDSETGQEFPRNSQTLLKVRRRLSEISYFSEDVSKVAVALSRSMAIVLNELFPFRPDSSRRSFRWTVDTITAENYQDKALRQRERTNISGSSISMEHQDPPNPTCQSDVALETMKLEAQGDENGWHVDHRDLYAILTLWRHSHECRYSPVVSQDYRMDNHANSVGPTVTFHRDLGLNPPPWGSQSSHRDPDKMMLHTDILTRDLAWWTRDPRVAALINTSRGSAWRNSRVRSKHELVIGFHGFSSSRNAEQRQRDDSIVSFVSSALILDAFSQHLFSGFMWAVSPVIPSDSFEQDNFVENSELFDVADMGGTWPLPTIRNQRITRLTREIEDLGLWTVHDALLALIPPFSSHGLLRNEAMLAVLLKKAEEYESVNNWTKVKDVYLNLFQIDLDPRSNDRLAYATTIEIIEFLFLAQDAMDDLRGEKTAYSSSSHSLAIALETIEKELASHVLLLTTLRELWPYLRLQKRSHKLSARVRKLVDLSDDNTEPSTRKTEAHPKNGYTNSLIKFTKYHELCSLIGEPDDLEMSYGAWVLKPNPDIFGWSPLHYAAVHDKCAHVYHKERDLPYFQFRDKSGKTPLHYAAENWPTQALGLLHNRYSATNLSVKGRDGNLPIHHAAKSHRVDRNILNLYMSFPCPPRNYTAPDKFGRTPLHFAAVHGNLTAVESFLPWHRTLPQSGEELLKMTPLHFAILHGHVKHRDYVAIITTLLTRGLKEMFVAGMEGATPISLMVMRANDGFLQKLLESFPRTIERPIHDGVRAIIKEAIKIYGFTLDLEEIQALFNYALQPETKHDVIFEAFAEAYSQGLWPLMFEMFEMSGMARKRESARCPQEPEITEQGLAIKWTGSRNAVKHAFAHTATSSRGCSELNTNSSPENISSLVHSSRMRGCNESKLKESSHMYEEPKTYLHSTNTIKSMSPASVLGYIQSQFEIGVSTILISTIRNTGYSDLHGTERMDFIVNFLELGLTRENPDSSHWNAKDPEGRSVVAWIAKANKQNCQTPASGNLREKILGLLWDKWTPGQRANALNEPQGRYNKTPLMYAVKNGLIEIAELFAKRGARIQGLDKKSRSASHFATADGISKAMWKVLVTHDPDVVNEKSLPERQAMIIQATLSLNVNLLEFLSKCERIDPNTTDIHGNTAILLACQHQKLDVIRQLLSSFRCTDPHIANHQGLSAVCYTYLTTRGAPWTSEEWMQETACQHSGDVFERFRLLLSHPSICLQGIQVLSVFNDAVRRSLTTQLELLLDLGFNPCSLDTAGRSVIFLAALSGYEIFNLVWERMACLEKVESQLEVVFHACAQRLSQGSKKIVSELLSSGIDPNVRDKNNWSALECAQRAGNSDVAELLETRKDKGGRRINEYASPTHWALRDDDPSFRNGHCIDHPSEAILEYHLPFHLETPVLIRTDHCIPYNLQRYDWEFTVLKQRGTYSDNQIAFGICTENWDPVPLPGFEGVSNSGAVLGSSDTLAPVSTDKPAMELFNVGHTVGCMVDLASHELVFSFDNGTTGTVALCKENYAQVYPCIAIWPNKTTEPGPLVRANFGLRQRPLSWSEEDTSSTSKPRVFRSNSA